MKRISFLIKPVSSNCNLRCKYCFYFDVSKNRLCSSFGKMSEDTMNALIERAFEYVDEGEITFAFQGGEPALIGLSYYKKFIAKVNQMKKNHLIHYVLQSNGTLFNEEWYLFLKENQFLVGISIDGFEVNNDYFRYTTKGEGVYHKIMDTILNLKKHKIEFNILTVLTRQLSAHPEKLFQFYKENKLKFIQIIPCLPPLGIKKDLISLTAHDYSFFFKKFYDLWLKEFNQGNYISISLFDNVLSIYANRKPSICGMSGNCSMQMVVESNGNVYPCDFYVLDKYLCGNIIKNSILEIGKSLFLKKFLSEDKLFSKRCEKCRFYNICRGGCKRLNITMFNDDYCGYEDFLEYSFNSMIQIINKNK